MDLSQLSPAPGSHKRRVRVGRGLGSGLGKTAGKGQKGQKSRSGGVKRPGFEGGQRPLYLRCTPRVIDFGSSKRGFYNKFAKHYVALNVEVLNRFEDGDTVDAVALIEEGIIKDVKDGIRILGNGDLSKKLTVRANGFSKTAEEKIIAAGGKVEVI